MKRVWLCVCLSLLLLVAAALPAFAVPAAYVQDAFDYVNEDELAQLNTQAAELHTRCGVAFFFVFTTDEVLTEYDTASLVGDTTDYFIMLENETSWNTLAAGLGETIDSDTENSLREVYDASPTYFGGISDYLTAAAAIFPAQETEPEPQNPPILIAPAPSRSLLQDDAALLSGAEVEETAALLRQISDACQAEIVVVTQSAVETENFNAYATSLYDSMGIGYGDNRDGVLLLVCMEQGQYRIVSNGYAGNAISGDTIDSIGDSIVPYLSDGEYAAAFQTFAEKCRYYLDGYQYGFPFDFETNLIVSIGIGIAIGVIVALLLKRQLKSVRMQHQAAGYEKPGSLQITVRNDVFLYRNVIRTEKSSDSSGSGSGSRSSSGGSRSVGGGSF